MQDKLSNCLVDSALCQGAGLAATVGHKTTVSGTHVGGKRTDKGGEERVSGKYKLPE